MSHFTQQTFDFLRQLTANNERHWFMDHKERYESDVRGPALAFIRAAGPHLAEISPELVADPRPTGGSLYRIHRDLRFSKDKTPYNPEIRIRIGHRQAKVRLTPGYFLQISPRQIKSGGGVYAASTADLNRVRDAIVAEPDAWRRAASAGQHQLRPGSLKRVPRGYPSDHSFVEDLKRTCFFLMVTYTPEQVIAPDFLQRFVANCRGEAPFMSFLAMALGVPW